MSQNHVAIIASVTNHAVYYAALSNYFHQADWAVTILGDAQLLKTVETIASGKDTQYIPTQTGATVAATIVAQRASLNQHTAVFFDEGYGRPAEFYRAMRSIDPVVSKIQTVHNVNTHLRPRFYMNWQNFRDNSYRIRSMKSMDALLVCSPVLKEYIQTQTSYAKDVYCIPFIRPAVDPSPIPEDGEITFAVPGGIHSKRRNYRRVLNTFTELWEEGVEVGLKFLGQASADHEDQQIIARCKDLQGKYGERRLTFYERRLSDEEFDRELRTADVILSNQELEYHLSGTREVYGQTKESGITYHMLNYAKPALVPHSLILMPRLNKQVLTYGSNGGLKSAVLEFAGNQQRMKEYSERAAENAAYFRSYFDREFQALLKQIEKQPG